MTSTELSDIEKKSLEEIPHPSLPDDAVDAARRFMGHLRDRRPASYAAAAPAPVTARAS